VYKKGVVRMCRPKKETKGNKKTKDSRDEIHETQQDTVHWAIEAMKMF
jgi:hypothetical protein